jgi:hypothetical protein
MEGVLFDFVRGCAGSAVGEIDFAFQKEKSCSIRNG